MIWTFSKMGIVGKIEKTLQSWYDYFSHGLKRIQEFLELVDIQKTSGGGGGTIFQILKQNGF